MSRFGQIFLPSTILGQWAVALFSIAIVIFAVNILIVQSGNQVAKINGIETLTNPEKVETSMLEYVLLYSILAGFILGGILGVASLFKRERAVLVWLAILFGVGALMVFVGGLFVEA